MTASLFSIIVVVVASLGLFSSSPRPAAACDDDCPKIQHNLARSMTAIIDAADVLKSLTFEHPHRDQKLPNRKQAENALRIQVKNMANNAVEWMLICPRGNEIYHPTDFLHKYRTLVCECTNDASDCCMSDPLYLRLRSLYVAETKLTLAKVMPLVNNRVGNDCGHVFARDAMVDFLKEAKSLGIKPEEFNLSPADLEAIFDCRELPGMAN